MSNSSQPPSPRDLLSRGRSRSPNARPDDVDEHQLHQDIDAARQMSRARAGSLTMHHQHHYHQPGAGAGGAVSGNVNATTSPQLIPGSDNSSGRRASHMPMGESLRRSGEPTTPGGTLQTPMVADSYYAGHSPSAHPHPSSASFQASSPMHAYGSQQQQQQLHPAARFYMQHRRQGSNSSLDSASHFIDHRNQQLPPPALSPGARMSNAGRRSQNRMEPASSDVTQQSRRRKISNMDSSAVDEETLGMHVDEARAAASHQERAVAPTGAGRSRQARERLLDLGGEDEEEEEANADEGHLRSGNAGTPNTMSRRNSMLQDDVCFPMLTPAEPHPSGIEAGVLGGPGSQYDHQHSHMDEQQHHDHHHHHHEDAHHETLPPGFPWTFDLGSLEDYANQEKKRIEEEASAAANVAAGWGLRNRGPASSNRDVKRRSVSDRRSMPGTYGISPDSDDATFYSRRPRKFVNVPGLGGDANGGQGNSASSRYQRKLALFEGAGSSPPPIGARANTHTGQTSGGGGIFGGGALMNEERDRHRSQAAQTANGYPADTKTPLLEGGNDTGLPSYQGTNWDDAGAEEPALNRSVSVGADLSNLTKNKKSKRPGRGPRSGSYNNDRQYRFTFYSNALPNTIHARHLYELPAPGQSFEELFMGLEPGGYKRDEGEATPPAAEATTPVASSQEKEKSPANRPLSGLTSVLQQAGRVESNTAPPTGSNTPEVVAPGAKPVGGSQGRLASAVASATARTSAFGGAASNEKARAMPGGGIRMDQDPEMCTWWLDVLCPTDQEMKMLSRVFGIHPLTTEDILMEETREKIELFRNYYLVCFRSFDQDPYSPTYLEPLNMYVIVFREGTLSFHFRATPHPQNVRRRIKQLKDYINVTSDWISYALIDDITDAFGPLIQSIEYEVDSIDELVLILKEAEQSDMLRRIGTCRKKVMGLLRLMGNKADVVKGLAKRCNENWSVAPKSDIGLYLSDIQDHLITMTQNLNHYEKILSRSHSNYLAQISIEMTDANNQINDVLSKLTALGTVIVPLNVITGLWGMNVNVPGQGVENLRWFFGIVSVMIALAVVGYFAAIRYLSR